jgi:hypothetical protein
LKVVLTPGLRLSYNVLVPATGSYVFTARIGSDPGTTGPLNFHYETATTNSGPIVGSGGGQWITTPSGQPQALTVGPVAVTFVVDSTAFTGGGFFLNWSEATKQ